jgi:spore maturation protein CgeB
MKKIKKLLMIGCNSGSESMPKYFREQCDYKELMLDGYLNEHLNTLLNSDYVPDIIFIQIQSDTVANRNTNTFIGDSIRAFKDKGSYVINWTGDMRAETPRWMNQFSHNVSSTMFSNLKDVDYCKHIGIETGFLQQGIDTNIFKPEGEKADVPDVVFLANNYSNQFPLSKYRREAVNRLRAHYGKRFKVFGNGWGIDSGNVNSSQYEEAKVYRGCKIAISISHFDVDRYFSDRLGRALCSGAMVLSHDYKGIEKDFQVGTHLDTFGSLDSMIVQIDKYLSHETEREQIAKAGQELASKEFSYQNVVKQILELG